MKIHHNIKSILKRSNHGYAIPIKEKNQKKEGSTKGDR